MAAFASAVTKQTVFGDCRVHVGTFASSGGATGGDIATGLSQVDNIILQPTAAAVLSNQCVVNETLPLASGSVTIVTDANAVGMWMAFGR